MAFYGSESGFGDYAEEMAYTVPAGDVEAALRRGTIFIDGQYRQYFPGTPTEGRDQPLEWPRAYAYDRYGALIPNDEVPDEVEQATYEAALIELNSPGSLSPTTTPNRIIKSASVEGAVSVTYEDSVGTSGERPQSSKIDDILGRLFELNTGSTGYVWLRRS